MSIGGAPRWIRGAIQALAAIRLAPAMLVGCAACVSPPAVEDLLAAGFRSPTQTFRTFQTAVRADAPDLEYRCFSSGFVARNHLSRFTYREFRDRMRTEEPFLRKGIADSEIVSVQPAPAAMRGEPVRLRVRSHGIELEILLVRDDFVEVWADDHPVVDELAPFHEHTGVQRDERGSAWFYGRVSLPPAQDASAVTELRVGREWKIDSIVRVDPTVRAGAIREDRLE